MDLPKAKEILKGLMARDHLPNCGAYNTENRRACTCGLESQAAVLHSVLQCLEPDVHSKPIMDLPRVRELLVAANKRPHLPGCGAFVLGGEDDCTCGKRTQDSLILDALKCLEPDEDNSYEEHVRLHKQLEERHPLNRIASALEEIADPLKKLSGDPHDVALDCRRGELGARGSVRRYKIRNIRDELETRVKIDKYRDSTPVTRWRSIGIYDPETQLTVTLSVGGHKDDTLESAADLRRRAMWLLAEKVLKHREESDG